MDDYYQHPLIGIPSRIRVKAIFKELNDISGKKLLDVGCEAGWITVKLAQKGAQVTAIDLIEEPIRELRRTIKEKNLSITLRVADATKLPFAAESFDIILATEVIEHITNLDRFVESAARVLRPGGVLLITFPNENLRQKLYPLVSLFGINAEVESQVTLKNYQRQEIIKLFSQRFKLIKNYTLPWWLPLTNLMLFTT